MRASKYEYRHLPFKILNELSTHEPCAWSVFHFLESCRLEFPGVLNALLVLDSRLKLVVKCQDKKLRNVVDPCALLWPFMKTKTHMKPHTTNGKESREGFGLKGESLIYIYILKDLTETTPNTEAYQDPFFQNQSVRSNEATKMRHWTCGHLGPVCGPKVGGRYRVKSMSFDLQTYPTVFTMIFFEYM